jgi:hypothetical protein
LDHACLGFRRATPQGWEQQTFTSSAELSHAHTLVLQTQDIEVPPPGGVTYTTGEAVDHTHTLFVDAASLRRLARGESIADSTSVSQLPSPHRHRFTLVDQVGLWGAPALLDKDDGTWPLPPLSVNPRGGRYNIEIYNMPSWMASRQPPLEPVPGISVALYNYISWLTEDPAIGRLYPATADNQPSVVLRKASPVDAYYSRAICGFEPWRLQPRSQLALADFILLRHFRLGLPD